MPPKIQDLQGLWRRSLIAWPNGVDDTTEVRWLQGTEVYVDLRQPAGLPDFVGRRGIAHLSMADCRALAVFMWARDRAIQLPPHKTLLECIAGAAALSSAQALIDCEIAFGSIDAGELRITASSLPYRIGDRLDPQVSGRWLTTRDRAADGTSVARHWEIVDIEGDLGAITDPAGASAA